MVTMTEPHPQTPGPTLDQFHPEKSPGDIEPEPHQGLPSEYLELADLTKSLQQNSPETADQP